MPQLPLTLANLGQLNNGTAEAVVNAAIQAAMSDTDDRGTDGKERKVNICLVLARRVDGNIEALVEAAPKLPPYKTASTVCKTTAGPNDKVRLLFSDDSPHDPDQRTIRDYIKDPSEIQE